MLASAVHILNSFYQHHINWQAALFGGEDMLWSKAELCFDSGASTQQPGTSGAERFTPLTSVPH